MPAQGRSPMAVFPHAQHLTITAWRDVWLAGENGDTQPQLNWKSLCPTCVRSQARRATGRGKPLKSESLSRRARPHIPHHVLQGRLCPPPPFKDRAVLRTALSLFGGRKHLKVRRRPPSTSRPYRSPMLGSEPARPKGGPSRTTTQSEPLPEGELRKRIAPRLRAHSRERTHARTHASSIRSAARNLVHCVGVAAHGASSWPSEASELKLSCADLPECASLANDSKLCTLSCAHFRT